MSLGTTKRIWEGEESDDAEPEELPKSATIHLEGFASDEAVESIFPLEYYALSFVRPHG